jgi:YidC/Oxa1 family membrane protein insertase
VDLLGTILWPLKWLVELVLVAWHSVLTAVGLPAAAGITWVLAIVGLVIVVRAALIPLFVKQIKSQRKMMEIAPELRKVQEKYKGKRDQLSREAMSRETMALYKKHGTTPVSSCLPLLVQMPVFFSLYKVLFVSIEMRHAPFFGWIHDLSAPDPTNVFTLFGLIPWNAPA